MGDVRRLKDEQDWHEAVGFAHAIDCLCQVLGVDGLGGKPEWAMCSETAEGKVRNAIRSILESKFGRNFESVDFKDLARRMGLNLLATEELDFRDDCPECGGDGMPELCGTCFPKADAARVERRALLAEWERSR